MDLICWGCPNARFLLRRVPKNEFAQLKSCAYICNL